MLQCRHLRDGVYEAERGELSGRHSERLFMFRGEIIAEYDRDYRLDETNFKLEHYIDLIERKPHSVYDAAPVKKTLPKPLYEFILTLDKPKEIIRILRCYLGAPNAAMKAIPVANYREFLMRYELVTGKEIPPFSSLRKRQHTG